MKKCNQAHNTYDLIHHKKETLTDQYLIFNYILALYQYNYACIVSLQLSIDSAVISCQCLEVIAGFLLKMVMTGSFLSPVIAAYPTPPAPRGTASFHQVEMIYIFIDTNVCFLSACTFKRPVTPCFQGQRSKSLKPITT